MISQRFNLYHKGDMFSLIWIGMTTGEKEDVRALSRSNDGFRPNISNTLSRGYR